MKADIKKCPECNSDMYARVVKKGPLKGSDGWGCPLCFALYPEDESKNKNFFLYIKDEFMQGWDEELEKQDEDIFDFWKKPKKPNKKNKDDSDLSE